MIHTVHPTVLEGMQQYVHCTQNPSLLLVLCSQMAQVQLSNATAGTLSAQQRLAAAQADLQKARAAATDGPARLATLQSRLSTLVNVTIPSLKTKVAGAAATAAAAQQAADAAKAAWRKASADMVAADDAAWEAQDAWQAAEDKVDELLSAQDKLVAQIADLSAYYSPGPGDIAVTGDESPAAEITANTTVSKSGQDKAPRVVANIAEELNNLALVLSDGTVPATDEQTAQDEQDAAVQQLHEAYQQANVTQEGVTAAQEAYQQAVQDLTAAQEQLAQLQEAAKSADDALAEATATLEARQADLAAARARSNPGLTSDATSAQAAQAAAQAKVQSATSAVSAAVQAYLAAEADLATAISSAAAAAQTAGAAQYYTLLTQKVNLEGDVAKAAGRLANATVSR
jgi:chromosome segregation ATPase